MGSNIFKNEDSKEEFATKVDTHTKALLTVTQRQKDLESTLDMLNEKIELLDHNAISDFKKIFSDIKSLRSEIVDLKSEIETLKEFNSKVAKQLRLVTTKDEVTKLEKYIDLWNPMDFVTREEHSKSKDEFVKILRQIIEEFLTGEIDQKILNKIDKKDDSKINDLKETSNKNTSNSNNSKDQNKK